MSRKLIVTRPREVRHGWSYKAFDFLIEVDGVLIGSVKNDQTVCYEISENEQWFEVLLHNGRRKPYACAIIPAGKENCHITVSTSFSEPVVALISDPMSE